MNKKSPLHMRNKRFCLLVLIALKLMELNAQNTLYSYNGVFRIALPPKLELQDSELNTIIRNSTQEKSPQANIRTQSGHITFQQKGLNVGNRAAYEKYCRVIIEYFKESGNALTFGRGDQIKVDRDVLYAVTEASEENCERSGTPFMKLISVQPLTINGFPVLYYSYRRMGWLKDDGNRQPPVIVNVFRIFNRYESVTLTFSYRESEREQWKSIHNNIIKTFTFTKKY